MMMAMVESVADSVPSLDGRSSTNDDDNDDDNNNNIDSDYDEKFRLPQAR